MNAPSPPSPHPGAGGLLALGDSLTVGEGSSMPGLPCRPWVSWLAEDLGLALTNRSANGAQVRDVRERQLFGVGTSFALGCLYIGANDARGPGFDARGFAVELDAVAGELARRSARLVMVTVPVDLGRPRAGAKVLEANSAIRRVADAHRATVVDNDASRGWKRVLPDAVHLTALGQRTLALDALGALALDGMLEARHALAGRDVNAATTLPGHQTLRYALTGHLPAVWHDLRRRAREGTLWAAWTHGR